MTMTNQHRLRGATEPPTTTPAGWPVPLAAGCYVESVASVHATASKVATLARQLGAIDSAQHTSYTLDLENTETEPEIADLILDDLTTALNEAALTGQWGWIDGELHYQPAEWEGWE